MGDTTERRWSHAELAELLAAKRMGLGWKATAARLPGRSAYQCEKKWQKRCFWLDDDDRIIAAQGAFGLSSQLGETQLSRVPADVLADRAHRARLAIEPRSVTAEFFRDHPLPGRSALD